MNAWSLVRRSLRFYWRTHLGVVFGAAVATAVLVGALGVGDSMRASLRAITLERLGEVEVALSSGDRLFRADLADRMAGGRHLDAAKSQESRAANSTPQGVPSIFAPALVLNALAAGGPDERRVHGVQLIGVDTRFWALRAQEDAGKQADPPPPLPADSVRINAALAAKLGARAGDLVLFRVAKPDALPGDAPLARDEDRSLAFRLKIERVIGPEDFGNFNLRAEQLAPLNAFVPLEWLQTQTAQPGRANVLLGGGVRNDGFHGEHGLNPAAELDKMLADVWRIEDAQLELREREGKTLELSSARIFIDEPTRSAVAKAAGGETLGALTYFVNELRAGERATPYSMVTAVGFPFAGDSAPPLPAPLPPALAADEIVINRWLAEDLDAQAGDLVTLRYFVIGAARRLEERETAFRVHSVVALEGFAGDPTLMPEFPGLSGAEDCAEWEPGVPVDLDRIRDKDERYWDDHRGTPKAFVSLAAGREMWGNRFGDLTALRLKPANPGPSSADVAGLIRSQLDPAAVGLFFTDVGARAQAATGEGLDFGSLFLGFSFFLIVAALMLTGLLFVFGIEQRAAETGALLAVGYRARQVRRLQLAEGGILALAGAALGLGGGVLYCRAALWALATFWRGAAEIGALQVQIEPSSLLIGSISGVLMALLVIRLALRRQSRLSVRRLLAGEMADDFAVRSGSGRGRSRLWTVLGMAGLGAAVVMIVTGAAQGEPNPGLFFGCGSVLLMSGLCLCRGLLGRLTGRTPSDAPLNLRGLAIRNAARRRGRSLTTIGLIAAGAFMVVSVGVFRKNAAQDAGARHSGTGGFELFGQSTLPVLHDLNSASGRAAYALAEADSREVDVTSFRVSDGDEASCLNLNRAQRPRLLGVEPARLGSLGAFTFTKLAEPKLRDQPWLSLETVLADGAVPAVADQATLSWALGLGVGDELMLRDELGAPLRLRIVGMVAPSILQGSVIIGERAFIRHFPSESGYRMFLIDTASDAIDATAKRLERALEPVGLSLMPAVERLAAFNRVENTYLAIFQALGGLGLLLGCMGLGMVVLRNVLERRAELALLRAVGFGRRRIRALVLAEHWLVLALGLVCGAGAGALSVLPSLLQPGANLPLGSLALTLAAVPASGALWTWLAARLALRGPLLDALRQE